MKDLPPPRDPIEAIGEAYEQLLEKILQMTHQEGSPSHGMHAGKLSADELSRLERYVKRDLNHAALFLNETGKSLQDWLGFDLALLKHVFWKMFSAAADKTMVGLLQIKLQAEIAMYHTGELTGLGTLVCDQCGGELHFYKPGHIPPCPKCNSTHFHRQHLA